MKKILLGLLIAFILITMCALLYTPWRERLIKTVMYFPTYNPFTSLDLDQQSISADTLGKEKLAASVFVRLKAPFPSGGERNVVLYLPKGYDGQDKKTLYPSLYLLHGSQAQEEAWVEGGGVKDSFDEAIEKGVLPPMIVVFPDGNGNHTADTQFINAADGKQKNEDFIVHTLPKFLESSYPIDPRASRRAIGGLSAGAFGAINLGLKHQDRYAFVLSFAGYGRIEQNSESKKLIQGSGQVIRENSPLDYIPKLKTHTIALWLTVGKSDGFLGENKALEKILRQNQFEVSLNPVPGIHNWSVWKGQVPNALHWLGEHLRK